MPVRKQTQKMILSDTDLVSRCRAISVPGSYSILPRANRVMHTLPNVQGGQAQVLAAPPLSSYYIAHELVLGPNGGTVAPIDENLEQFLYVLEGSLNLSLDGKTHPLSDGCYGWLPPQRPYEFVSKGSTTSRVLWLRRKYKPLAGQAVPEPIVAHERDAEPFPEDTYMEQHLVPYEDIAHDMAFNLLTFEPGEYFPFVESHIMEHALYMLKGTAIYVLNGDYHEVQQDDFIYMAAYCPQFAFATGWGQMRYMVYKDVNRDYDWTL